MTCNVLKGMLNLMKNVIFQQNTEFTVELKKSLSVIVMNARICLQQKELYPDQSTIEQLVSILLEERSFLQGIKLSYV